MVTSRRSDVTTARVDNKDRLKPFCYEKKKKHFGQAAQILFPRLAS